MGIYNKLTKEGSIYSSLDGKTPSIPDLKGSKLHNEYSLNGQPNMNIKQQPSLLDLNGKTPEKYLDQIHE